MIRLRCVPQNYDWGRLGLESRVGQLLKSGGHAEAVDSSKPYAELWMGVHPNGLSLAAEGGVSLEKLIKEDGALGDHEAGTLQFLFKVLSVRRALSIQTHPTKDQANQLHVMDPKNYPDANHKPEMAIAVTDFELLCGFRPNEQIYRNIRAYPELRHLLACECCHMEDLLNSIVKMREQALQKLFTKLWSLPPAEIAKGVEALVARLQQDSANNDATEKLMIRLHSEFPGDVGVLAPLFLNYFTLKPGQATFLGPNRPHAYLFGDCIECMACSDNTIRAGLTPKFKDITTLCKNMDYTMSDPPILAPQKLADGLQLYAPDTPEFAVADIRANVTLPDVSASSILIVTEGSATIQSGDQKESINPGTILFIPKKLTKISIGGASADFVAYRAYTPKK